VAAVLDGRGGQVVGELPEGAAAYYFNLIDDRGLLVSSEHVEVKQTALP
jgi:hypothetical protein